MAKFEVIIPYRSMSGARLGIFCLVWFGLLIVVAIALGNILAIVGDIFPFSDNWLLSFLAGTIFSLVPLTVVCLALFVPYLLFVNFLEGNKIIATRDGFSYPAFRGQGFGVTRFQRWKNLIGVSMSTSDPDAVKHHDKLCLLFRDGKSAALKLSKTTQEDQEKILLAIDMFANDAEKDDNFRLYQNSLQNKLKGIEGISYTKLWEDELKRRFSSTSFIPLKPGQSLQGDRLKVERQIAFGGFAAIYLVTEEPGQRHVLKELVLDEQYRTGKVLDLFIREFDLLYALNHPQIAKVHERFQENGRQYILLEHVPGCNLRQHVSSRGALPESEVVELAAQMTEILEYLHTREPAIIHRDFTPDNLILKPDGTIVLVDFGAANEFMGEATGTLVGKHNYMPPEQVRAKSGLRSDYYALGGTLYFLLTGEDPIALHACRPSLRADSKISEQLDQLVYRLMQLDYEDRPESLAIVRDQLRGAKISSPDVPQKTLAETE